MPPLITSFPRGKPTPTIDQVGQTYAELKTHLASYGELLRRALSPIFRVGELFFEDALRQSSESRSSRDKGTLVIYKIHSRDL